MSPRLFAEDTYQLLDGLQTEKPINYHL